MPPLGGGFRNRSERPECAFHSMPGLSSFEHYPNAWMSPEALPRALQPFCRVEPSRSQGTGLGLSIVGRLCDRLGWPINLTSEPGVGTQGPIACR